MLPLVLLFGTLANPIPSMQAKEVPTEQMIHRALRYAGNAYCSPESIKAKNNTHSRDPAVAGFDEITVSSDEQTQWVSGYDSNAKEIVVAFKGSFGKINWRQNFRIHKDTTFVNGTGMRIQRGWKNLAFHAAMQLDPTLSALTEKHPEASVHFTGHSLGAVLAYLVPVISKTDGCLKNFDPSKIKVTALGAPAIGNKSWKSFYESLGFVTTRVVNLYDPVPKFLPTFDNRVWKWFQKNLRLSPKVFGWMFGGYFHTEDTFVCINDDPNETMEIGKINGACTKRWNSLRVVNILGKVGTSSDTHCIMKGVKMGMIYC
jgi:hypothetical protein